jgi:hypothetical protein
MKNVYLGPLNNRESKRIGLCRIFIKDNLPVLEEIAIPSPKNCFNLGIMCGKHLEMSARDNLSFDEIEQKYDSIANDLDYAALIQEYGSFLQKSFFLIGNACSLIKSKYNKEIAKYLNEKKYRVLIYQNAAK